MDDVAFVSTPTRAGMIDGCSTAILWASGFGEGSGVTVFQGCDEERLVGCLWFDCLDRCLVIGLSGYGFGLGSDIGIKKRPSWESLYLLF